MNIELKKSFKQSLAFSIAMAFMIQGLQAITINEEEINFGDDDIVHVSLKTNSQYQHIILDIEDGNITTSTLEDVSVIENTISKYEELNAQRDSLAKITNPQGSIIERPKNADTKGPLQHKRNYVYASDEFIANSNNKIIFDSTIAEAGKSITAAAPEL